MFDIGGSELLVIAVVALVVLGPKELPTAVRSVQGFIRKARALAHDFQSGLNEMAREIELDKMKEEVKTAFDPGELDKIGNTIHKEFTSASDELKSTLDPNAIKDFIPPEAAPSETAASVPGAAPPTAAEPAPAEIAPPPESIATGPSPKPGV